MDVESPAPSASTTFLLHWLLLHPRLTMIHCGFQLMFLDESSNAVCAPLAEVLADDLGVHVAKSNDVSVHALCCCKTARPAVTSLHLARLGGKHDANDAQFRDGSFTSSVFPWVSLQPFGNVGVQQALGDFVEGRSNMRSVDSSERLDGVLVAYLLEVEFNQTPGPRRKPKDLAAKRVRSCTMRYETP